MVMTGQMEHEVLEREIERLRTLYQQQQQQPQQKQQPHQQPPPSHQRAKSQDLDSQFASISLIQKDSSSGPDSVSGGRFNFVHMQGIAVGRAVDLTLFSTYEDLLRKLEAMFEIEGELCGSEKKWQVVYIDDEDDIMMVDVDPWQCNFEALAVEVDRMLRPEGKLFVRIK